MIMKYVVILCSLIFIFASINVNAKCKANSIGTVYCSKTPNGGAMVNYIGTVKCGKGECKQNSIGTVKCSVIEGGGATVNSIGTVKCLGGCENGNSSMCESGLSNFNTNTNYEDFPDAVTRGLWTNTNGRIRDIRPEEVDSTINTVGIIKCKNSDGTNTEATGTLVPSLKGTGPLILFSGHTTCDDNNRIPVENCVFLHAYVGGDENRYGKVYEHRFDKRSTKFKCDDDAAEPDIAVATLKDFDGYGTSTITMTGSVNKNRQVDEEGNITYKSSTDRYSDATMLLVGNDFIHNKLMISENCGLIDKSDVASLVKATNSQITHDCLATAGYSGGPIFQKRWDKVKEKYEYKLVCVNSGNTSFKSSRSKNFRKIIEGRTGGRCESIERKILIPLYEKVGRA